MKPIKLTDAQLDHAIMGDPMPKHKRSNYRLRNSIAAELASAHRNFEVFRQGLDHLQAQRSGILRHAETSLTREDYNFVVGYGRALWDSSWNKLDWKLGHEDPSLAKPSRTPPELGGWDYKEGPPTYGGHFHPSGELATTWEPFDRSKRGA